MKHATMNNTYKRLLGNKWVLRTADVTQEQIAHKTNEAKTKPLADHPLNHIKADLIITPSVTIAPVIPTLAPVIQTSVGTAKTTVIKNTQAQQDYKLIILGHNISPEMTLQDDNTQATIMLKKMLQAMKLDLATEIYLHNMPTLEHTAERPCSFQFIEELNLQASAICLFGTQAIKSDFIPNMAINKIRGLELAYKNTPVIVTFSLPYILRNPDVKPLVWSDLQKIMAIISN